VILTHRLFQHRADYIEGPFTLGPWGRPINIIAITWVTFISVVLFFPSKRPVTASNM
jgi:hypothetical protein